PWWSDPVPHRRRAPAPPARGTAEQGATARTAPVRKPAQVVRVVDGDTLRLRVDGLEEPVRLIGINTPESVDPRRPVECLGKEASAKTAELLRGVQTVEVEPDRCRTRATPTRGCCSTSGSRTGACSTAS